MYMEDCVYGTRSGGVKVYIGKLCETAVSGNKVSVRRN